MAGQAVIFQDLTTPTGSRLFGGSEIRAWVQRLAVAGAVNVDIPFRPNQEQEFLSADNSKIGSMWNRRKSNIQVTGHEALQFNLFGGWTTGSNELGSQNGTIIVLSPYKLIRMALSGHTFYMKGAKAVQSLIDGEAHDLIGGTQVGSLYTGSGIPIIITNWSTEDVAENDNYVSWEMTCAEDKDIAFLNN